MSILMSIGYDFDRFVGLTEQEIDDYKCGICHLLLRSPVVTICCQNMFCNICINEWLKTSHSCPYCRKSLSASGLNSPARVLTNILANFKIKCDFDCKGCPEVLILDNLSKHVSECDFANLCDKCLSQLSPNHDCYNQLIQTNKESKELIQRLETERDCLLKQIQDLSLKFDPVFGPSDKRIFKAWNMRTFGQEINEHQILMNARQYLSEPIITENKTNEEIGDKIVDILKEELIKQNTTTFDICQHVVQKLDLLFGNSWQCVADYDNSSVAFFTFQMGFLVKIRFGLLLFKVFKAFNSDEHNFIQRVRALDKISRVLDIKRSENMDKNMISFVKTLTFRSIERLDSFKEISCEIQTKMRTEFGGQWLCIVFSVGSFQMTRIKGFYIDFQLFDINFYIFQTND